MNKDLTAFYFLIIFSVLSACQPSLPSATQLPSSLSVTNTPTMTANSSLISTNTTEPTIITTPINTITPTRTKTYMDTNSVASNYYKGVAPDLNSFSLVKDTEIPIIVNDIASTPQLSGIPKFENTFKLFPISSGQLSWTYVQMECIYKVTCIVRASIRSTNPYGGLDLWKLIWEVLEIDGKHKNFIGYIGGMGKATDYYGATINYEVTHTAQRSLAWVLPINNADENHLLFVLFFTRTILDNNKINPYSWDISNGAKPKDQTILRELENGGNSLPDGLNNMTLQIQIGGSG